MDHRKTNSIDTAVAARSLNLTEAEERSEQRGRQDEREGGNFGILEKTSMQIIIGRC